MATKLKCPRVAVLGLRSAPARSAVLDRLSPHFGVLFFETADEARRAGAHLWVVGLGGSDSAAAEPDARTTAEERLRTHAVRSIADLHAEDLWERFLTRSVGDPMRIRTDRVPLDPRYVLDDPEPLVSVFTTSYRSGDRILRPFRSLMAQTYPKWEWVVLDDTPQPSDNWALLRNLAERDPRVRCYEPDRASGYIGEVKRFAAGLCTGKLLVELDHDDDLEPQMLDKIVRAFRANPTAGFVYSDWAEVEEGSLGRRGYPEGFAFGYGSHYHVFSERLGVWVQGAKCQDLASPTARDSVGMPNHVRCWRADFYAAIGGHNRELSVADDYELFVRTMLRTDVVRIPDVLYLQYVNRGGASAGSHPTLARLTARAQVKTLRPSPTPRSASCKSASRATASCRSTAASSRPA